MKKRHSRFGSRLFAVFNGVIALLFCFSAWSGLISPERFPLITLIELGFPIFSVLVLFVLALDLLFQRKLALIPLSAICLSLSPLLSYFPLNMQSDEEADLKIVTFNTRNFGGHKSDAEGHNEVLRYMVESEADVVCFQEGAGEESYYLEVVIPYMKRHGYSVHYKRTSKYATIGFFSRLPLDSIETVDATGANHVVSACVMLPGNKPLHIVNCHLVSNALSEKDRQVLAEASRRNTNVNKDVVEQSAKGVFSQLISSGKLRAVQVDSVARYIARHSRQGSIFVCGDFNDTPVSYAHRCLSAGLTDCYRSAGFGLGRTFNRDRIVVRIDHAFCSKDFEVVGCNVVHPQTTSDHYPLECLLKIKKN